MYKTILVPLDGSNRAEAILPHVEELAQRYQALVVFVRVMEPMPYLIGPEGMPVVLPEAELEQCRKHVRDYMDAIADDFRERGINATSQIRQGPVVKSIIEAAAEQKADLIAIASHGRSGLSQFFYGSVAAGVLQRVERPLLVVRSRG